VSSFLFKILLIPLQRHLEPGLADKIDDSW
jgi:hypothetical protein